MSSSPFPFDPLNTSTVPSGAPLVEPQTGLTRTHALSVVVPTFNERENIRVLVPMIQDVFEKNGIDGEIVIVDDRSTDGSFELFESLARTYRNLIIRIRSGAPSIARAWYEGFELASKENIVCIDGDLCHDPAYFPDMLSRLDQNDLVIGSRYLEKTMMVKDKSWLASYVSFVGQFITRLATGFRETDTSHSFRLFRKSVFEAIKGRLKSEGNVFLIEFLILAKNGGCRVTEIPIKYGKRIHGETKLKVFREGIRYLKYIATVLSMRLRS
jgi:dolichol-phosphate mannosyltransferase